MKFYQGRIDRLWDYFPSFIPELPHLDLAPSCLVASYSGPNPVYIEDVVTEGNLATISRTIPIDISTTPGVIEHVFIGAYCSPEEIEIYTALFE